MTPLEIEAALYFHYTGSTERFDACNHAPVVVDATMRLVRLGLVEMFYERGDPAPRFRKTEGIDVYVHALTAIPLPVQQWIIPAL